MKDSGFLWRGLMAGVCISLGGCIYLKVGGVAGAVLFAFGLIAVVTLGLNLFTGKAQFVWSPRVSQTEQGGYLWLLSILLLNIMGCLAAGLLLASTEMQAAAASVLDKRLSMTPLRNALLAVGCGFVMTLAVQNAAKGKWLPLLFGIPAFIICGLPHCVADAFYMASLPAEYIGRHLSDLTIFYVSIVAGNFVGCNAYRLVNVKQEQAREVWP